MSRSPARTRPGTVSLRTSDRRSLLGAPCAASALGGNGAAAPSAFRLEKRTHLDARSRVLLRHFAPGLAEVGWSFIPAAVWHDLRHTWASWHVQAGTPLHVLQELGSWECVEMVRKYAHLASDRLAQHVDRMSGLRVVQEGESATVGLRGRQMKRAAFLQPFDLTGAPGRI